MTLKCEAFSAFCALEKFTINGIHAEYDDFGDKRDINPELAEPYCCGNMQFIPKKSYSRSIR